MLETGRDGCSPGSKGNYRQVTKDLGEGFQREITLEWKDIHSVVQVTEKSLSAAWQDNEILIQLGHTQDGNVIMCVKGSLETENEMQL